jgi:hypothetical protein
MIVLPIGMSSHARASASRIRVPDPRPPPTSQEPLRVPLIDVAGVPKKALKETKKT